MSVIAWDGKILAADKCSCNADYRTVVTKLVRIESGIVLGWTGAMEHGLGLKDWYINGAKKENWPAFQQKDNWTRLIVGTPTGSVFQYEQEPFPQLIEDQFSAWGSGRDYALGAMEMGADAIKAVEVASRFNAACGFGVDYFRLLEAADEWPPNGDWNALCDPDRGFTYAEIYCKGCKRFRDSCDCEGSYLNAPAG